MSTPTDKDDRRGELTVSRVVDAPRDLVWQAFTEPEHLATFWGGTTRRTGRTLARRSADVRWRHRLAALRPPVNPDN
jgi:uncharacterized protein YndB with AHSA1/START domain